MPYDTGSGDDDFASPEKKKQRVRVLCQMAVSMLLYCFWCESEHKSPTLAITT